MKSLGHGIDLSSRFRTPDPNPVQVWATHSVSTSLGLTVSEPVYPEVLACFHPIEMLEIPKNTHVQCDGD